jgi:hypothetical protein
MVFENLFLLLYNCGFGFFNEFAKFLKPPFVTALIARLAAKPAGLDAP